MATWAAIGGRSVKSVQATTEAAPAAGDGVLLDGVIALEVWAEADAGQTLTGAGQVDIYRSDALVAGVASSPSVVMLIPPELSGARRGVVGTVPVANPRGRAIPLCNGVNVSGGEVTIYVLCTGVGGKAL